MAGQRFGRWLVLAKNGNAPGGGARWLCRCDCGTERAVMAGDLRQGKSVSCRCARQHAPKTNRKWHGGSKTRLHRIWKMMRTRCLNPNYPETRYYGGRGITICPEWRSSFVTFRDWALSAGYSDSLSIERKDVNAGYTPENCTWATARVQSVNRRFVRKNPDGIAWCEIARANGITAMLKNGRVHEGWPEDLAATLPKGSRIPKDRRLKPWRRH